MEYLQRDSHSFILDEPGALATFFGEGSEDGQHCQAAINRTAARLATVFATMKVGCCCRHTLSRYRRNTLAGSRHEASEDNFCDVSWIMAVIMNLPRCIYILQ